MTRFLCSGRILGGTAILLSTIIILIVFANPPQTRILHSSSPQTTTPKHNSSAPWHPDDVRCSSGVPDTSHIQVVVKTGSNIIYDKLPTQLLTALRCCQDPLIFADSEQDIGAYHVYDVLANVNETLKATHPDFAYYRTIKEYLSAGRDIRQLRTSRQAAWDLDKYKFIHMLVQTWARRPGHDWYVFVEADTYLFWGNLVQWLARMDPAQPLYLGSAATFQSQKFAHGGSGVILSREAMRRVLDGDADLAARYDERMHDEIYGDYVLMKALKEKGVELTNKWPMMQGEKQNTLPVTPVDVNEMWNYEQRRKHPQDPLLISELYDYFMGRQRQKSPSEMTPVEKEAYSSFEQCQKACQEHSKCFQFAYHDQTCGFSFSYRLGYQKDPEDGKGSYKSGWILDKIEKDREDHPCKTPEWL
ncbi:hypothetical protein ANOM_005524 [Aspergillus nomiae NRRL 13137]|uniref:N-acetylgalactosaminide beta-1,3-galactosyltransferase n=1 Tax=Aspergillus nomiae NRRL (strain ATCC 15546 / NRRL 13137 / CBS 260.88 / M93) TaxID=1509407 RepID=A0A0L1J3E4_ASPN3|nr:uncharacterized protein ANOM_005524 [Aspergillus nomiae NRRL 13137]KNG86190.1 hypothetical protein ANOM_005524 [Aspergillus nomiae NRRL 13137]